MMMMHTDPYLPDLTSSFPTCWHKIHASQLVQGCDQGRLQLRHSRAGNAHRVHIVGGCQESRAAQLPHHTPADRAIDLLLRSCDTCIPEVQEARKVWPLRPSWGLVQHLMAWLRAMAQILEFRGGWESEALGGSWGAGSF